MTATVLAPADVSTSAADFQANGTAAPGSTGRVADAGHVHPSGSSVGCQVVTQNVYCTVNNGDGTYSPAIPVTLDAPTGYLVVNGGYTIINGVKGIYGMPALDGSSWAISTDVWTTNTSNNSLIGEIFAICVATS